MAKPDIEKAARWFEKLTCENLCTYEDYLVNVCGHYNSTVPPVSIAQWDAIVSTVGNRDMVYSGHAREHKALVAEYLGKKTKPNHS
ncbi:MAG: hypothetical protein N0E44_18985 [Candidatus Thiodiazotropha lotti]|nr:hypothetical protein [Candidatus Thiodiazotropha lotti]MCW4221971.1 hypothetical protein [Candidatus Thiodiazotropha lotti]